MHLTGSNQEKQQSEGIPASQWCEAKDFEEEEHRRDICQLKNIKERKGQCIQNYACRFGKIAAGDQIISSWWKCWCTHWLLSSLLSGTTWGKFLGGCSVYWFGCNKVPWLQGWNLKKNCPFPKDCTFHMQVLHIWKT